MLDDQYSSTQMPAQETDITHVLVIALVVMIGGLVVMMSNNFVQTPTSSSTRASAPKLPAEDAECQNNSPFGEKFFYSSSHDYCMTWGSVCKQNAGGSTNYVRDMRSDYATTACGYIKMPNACCRNNMQDYTQKDFYGKIVTIKEDIEGAFGTPRCVRETNHVEATCVGSDTTNADKTLSDAKVKCAVRRNNYNNSNDDAIIDGECYYNALMPTIAPMGGQPNGKRADSCGLGYINCNATWKDGLRNPRNSGVVNKSGQVLQPDCQGISGQGYESYHCGVRVNNSVTTCDGGQWANPISLNNGVINQCYMTELGVASLGTSGQQFKMCIFKPTTEIASIGRNLTTSECKAQAERNLATSK